MGDRKKTRCAPVHHIATWAAPFRLVMSLRSEGRRALDPDAHWLTRFISSPLFEIVSLIAILINAVLLACQVHFDGFDYAYYMNHPYSTVPAQSRWPNADKVFDIVSLCFVCIFVVELFLRLVVMRCGALRSRWIWLD